MVLLSCLLATHFHVLCVSMCMLFIEIIVILALLLEVVFTRIGSLKLLVFIEALVKWWLFDVLCVDCIMGEILDNVIVHVSVGLYS